MTLEKGTISPSLKFKPQQPLSMDCNCLFTWFLASFLQRKWEIHSVRSRHLWNLNVFCLVCMLPIYLLWKFCFLPVLISDNSCLANKRHHFMLVATHTFSHLGMRSKCHKKEQELADTGCIQTPCNCCLRCSSFSLLVFLVSHLWPGWSPWVPQLLGLNSWTVSVLLCVSTSMVLLSPWKNP